MRGGKACFLETVLHLNNKNSSSDFSLMMVSFDESRGFETFKSLHKVEATTEQVGNIPYFHLINQKYEEPLSFQIGIMKLKNCDLGEKFTNAEISNIAKWLTFDDYTKLTVNNRLLTLI